MESLESSPGLVCPITQSLMYQPVIGTDGYTYERQAIEEWLARHRCSPMTREPMSAADLRPNRAVADQIQWLLEANPGAAASFAAEEGPPAPTPPATGPSGVASTSTSTLKTQIKADVLHQGAGTSPSAPPAAAATPSYLTAQPGFTGPSAPPLPQGFSIPQQRPAVPQQPLSHPAQQRHGHQAAAQPQQVPDGGAASGEMRDRHRNGRKGKKVKPQRRIEQNNNPEDLSANFKTYGRAIKVKPNFNANRDLAEGGKYNGGVVVKPSHKNSGCVVM